MLRESQQPLFVLEPQGLHGYNDTVSIRFHCGFDGFFQLGEGEDLGDEGLDVDDLLGDHAGGNQEVFFVLAYSTAKNDFVAMEKIRIHGDFGSTWVNTGIHSQSPAFGQCFNSLLNSTGDADSHENGVCAAAIGEFFDAVNEGFVHGVDDGVRADLLGERSPFRIGLADNDVGTGLFGQEDMQDAHDAGADDDDIVGGFEVGVLDAAIDAADGFGQGQLFEGDVVGGFVDLVVIHQDVLAQAGRAGDVGVAEGLAVVIAAAVHTLAAGIAVAAAGEAGVDDAVAGFGVDEAFVADGDQLTGDLVAAGEGVEFFNAAVFALFPGADGAGLDLDEGLPGAWFGDGQFVDADLFWGNEDRTFVSISHDDPFCTI